MNQQPHTVIRASAGTGKTHALTNRILALLLAGVKPERIIALTFNRTAAGEIFDTVIGRLAKGARDDAEAAALAAELREIRGREPLDAAKCRETLRRLLLRMHLSPIGTIDSFFVKIIRAFPFEHGISGEFAIAGEGEQKLQREQILRGLLQPPADDAEARGQQAFYEAFKRATFGHEEKRLHDLLAEFVESYHGLYLDAADLARWGEPSVIWETGAPWRQFAPEELAKTVCELRERLALGTWSEKQQAKWDEFLDFAGEFTPESPYSSTTAPTVLAKLLECLPVDPEMDGSVRAQFSLFKPVELSEAASALAFRLARHVGACVLKAREERTRGIGEIVSRFDAMYDTKMRRAGRLTFGDIQFLLSGGYGEGGGQKAEGKRQKAEGGSEDGANGEPRTVNIEHPTPNIQHRTSNAEHRMLDDEAADRRMHMEYRLDTAYDHWALDEFQDTSRRQWNVIENLLDEVIQTSGGERSALIVGDVKQAIYGWRGGDSRLMEEIVGKYNGEGKRQKAEGRSEDGENIEHRTSNTEHQTACHLPSTAYRPVLQVKSLVKTWRCRPAIIETVNRVFTHLESTPELEALGVCQEWNRLWEKHESEKKDAGHVAFTMLPKPEGRAGGGDAVEARMAVVCGRLLEVRPWERGLSAAVLVRGNKAGREALDGLRRSQIPCALVGEERLADNPLVLACVSLVKAAAHPGDTQAWEHLRMTPFLPLLPARPGLLAESFLRDMHEHGFEAALRPWIAKILEPVTTGRRAAGAPGEFTRRRAEQLLAAAQAFDGGGSKDGMEFAEFVTDYRIVEPPAAGVVQIMTMHKSKGLGFDLVFLPDMQAGNICSAGIKGLHADTDGRGGTNWVLDMPGQAFSGADSALREAVRRADRAGCFEELCLLYVAMTRAKRELQIIATEPGKTAKSVHLATVLANSLVMEGKRQKEEGKRQKAEGRSEKAESKKLKEANTEPLVAGGPLYACGDADWWREEPGAPGALAAGRQVCGAAETKQATEIAKQETSVAARKRHPRRLPSRAKAEAYPAGNLFAAASAKGREHGTALHGLFQEVTWAGAEPVDGIIRRWRAKAPAAADVAESAERAFRKALTQPEVRAALAEKTEERKNGRTEDGKGGKTIELWREKSFELILDGEWVSGAMDRVVVVRNTAGVAESAEILDYKSDRIADESALAAAAKKYALQMALYRRVLTCFTGLRPEKIRCRLLFTGAGRAVEVG